MTPVWVTGVGLHRFGRFPGISLTAMGVHAARQALAEADVPPDGPDMVFCGTVYGGVAAGHKVCTALGRTGMPILNVEAGCASGGAAVGLAADAVASGRARHALVLGLEKMPRGMIRSSFFEPWRERAGLSATPAYFALRAQRLLREHDLDVADLARVVATNRAHGVHNPDAMYPTPVTADAVLASPLVCAPLHRLMLCAPNEGAAALVLSATPGAAPRVRVAATALRSHRPGAVLGEHTPLCGLVHPEPPPPTCAAADAAYATAGIGPGDCNVVELQDTDAARHLLSAMELGLCPPDALARWLRDGGGTMTSRQPVNPSGGLLARGEPLGASALAQVVELVRQLRGTAGARQVAGARTGLAHTVGRGANACVMILQAG